MIGPLRDSVQRSFHFLAALVGKVFAGAINGTILLIGVYFVIFIAWSLFQMAVSPFGYELQSAQRERQEMYAFIGAHRLAFCNREHVPPAYCDKIFNDSAAGDLAYRTWVQTLHAREDKRRENAPWWGFLEPFRDPLVKRW